MRNTLALRLQILEDALVGVTLQIKVSCIDSARRLFNVPRFHGGDHEIRKNETFHFSVVIESFSNALFLLKSERGSTTKGTSVPVLVSATSSPITVRRLNCVTSMTSPDFTQWKRSKPMESFYPDEITADRRY
eukprot:IDg7016t1